MLRGFVKLKKIQKLGSGWVGQAPIWIFFFFLEIVWFLCCFLLLYMFPHKN